MEEPKILNAIYDNPQDTDFKWSDYAGGNDYVEGNERKRFPGRDLKVWNQNAYNDTVSGCGIYGLTYIYNGNQINEFSEGGIVWEQEDPRWKRYAFQAERGNPGNAGSSLQDCMKFFRKRKLIDGYLMCNNVDECKNAIKNGFGIYTGTKKCNWRKTSQTGEFEYDENGAAHCIAIVDYDDTGFWSINSFGKAWGKEGFFHIDYEKYKYLYTIYAIIDHDDSGRLDEMIYNMEYNKAQELGITNGANPDEPITRKQGAVMVYRAYKKVLDSK